MDADGKFKLKKGAKVLRKLNELTGGHNHGHGDGKEKKKKEHGHGGGNGVPDYS